MFQRNEGLPQHPPVRPTQVQARSATQQGLPAHDHAAPASKAEEMIALLNQRVGQPQGR